MSLHEPVHESREAGIPRVHWRGRVQQGRGRGVVEEGALRKKEVQHTDSGPQSRPLRLILLDGF